MFLNLQTIKSLAKHTFDIEVYSIPPMQSSSNGQIERFHGTIIEIARCLKLESAFEDTIEPVLKATRTYNRSIRSTTELRPTDIIQSIPDDLRKKMYRKI